MQTNHTDIADANRFLELIQDYPRLYTACEWYTNYADDPPFTGFHITGNPVTRNETDGSLHDINGYGFSSNPLVAYCKAAGEVLERYSSVCYRTKKLLFGSRHDVPDSIDPKMIPNYSNKQKAKFRYEYDPNATYYWQKTTQLQTGATTYIPAQLIYTNYEYHNDEQFLRSPISTGASGGWTITDATLGGIYEDVERDAMMIFYLNMIQPPKLRVQNIQDNTTLEIIDLLRRYGLQTHIYDITTDIPIPTYMVLLEDNGDTAPFSFGTKAHLDPVIALRGAIEEAIQTRRSARSNREHLQLKLSPPLTEPKKIITIQDRAKYWASIDYRSSLAYLFDRKFTHYTSFPTEPKNISAENQLKEVKKIFQRQNIPLYVADITDDLITASGYRVIKAFAPDLQPLYFYERYPYWGIQRLFDVPVKLGYCKKPRGENDLNPVPHPIV